MASTPEWKKSSPQLIALFEEWSGTKQLKRKATIAEKAALGIKSSIASVGLLG